MLCLPTHNYKFPLRSYYVGSRNVIQTHVYLLRIELDCDQLYKLVNIYYPVSKHFYKKKSCNHAQCSKKFLKEIMQYSKKFKIYLDFSLWDKIVRDFRKLHFFGFLESCATLYVIILVVKLEWLPKIQFSGTYPEWAGLSSFYSPNVCEYWRFFKVLVLCYTLKKIIRYGKYWTKNVKKTFFNLLSNLISIAVL